MRRKRLGRAAPLLIVMAGYSLSHMMFAGYTKYRIPLDNLTAVLAAVAIIALFGIASDPHDRDS